MEILEEIIEVFDEVVEGIKTIFPIIKNGLATINANPFIAGIRKALSIIFGIIGSIFIIVNWIKSKI